MLLRKWRKVAYALRTLVLRRLTAGPPSSVCGVVRFLEAMTGRLSGVVCLRGGLRSADLDYIGSHGAGVTPAEV
jgi:hypothetical protein